MASWRSRTLRNALTATQTLGPVASPASRLSKGPAYEKSNPQSATRNPQSTDWPAYRHDSLRSGGISATVPAELKPAWQVQLAGTLTQPVVAGDLLYVASRDTHTLYALNAETGEKRWSFIAGGRIDSPPTIHNGLVLIGSADGWVYCLRASDGQLAWRFRAAPSDRRIVAFDQLESPWRVHGSVLIAGDVAYCTAGRSTNLDGGILVFGLDPATGRVLHETRLDSGILIAGKIDRIDKMDDGSLKVIDYKTGKLPFKKDDESIEKDDLQLSMYAMVVMKKYGVPVSRCSLVFLAHDEEVGFTPTMDMLKGKAAVIADTVKQIESDTEFVPKENHFCPWCEYREICPLGENIEPADKKTKDDDAVDLPF